MGESYHKHQCPECGTVWEHPDTVLFAPRRLRVMAHRCPRCLCGQGEHYRGDEPAEFSNHHLSPAARQRSV